MNKVLFIEDDIQTQKIFTERFSGVFEVLIASTGIEGMDFAVRQKPDAIVLDIILGGKLNGFDVLKELKMHPESKNIPVIVLTNLEGQEATAKDMGAVECVIKANTSINEVEKIIKKYLP